MHICLFTDSLEPSGVGTHMLALAAELRTRYHVSLICPPSPGGRRLLAQAGRLGLQTLALEARFHQPAALAALRDWLAARQVDVCHVHAGIGWEGFGGADAARAAGVPAVVRTEHLPYLLTHPVQRADHARTVQVVDRLICVSAAVGESYLAAGVPARKLSVVRNGIAVRRARADLSRLRADLGLPPHARLVLTVGRFTDQKGHRYLLDSLPQIRARVPEAHLLWAGEGPLHDTLRAAVRAHGLAGHVHFLGACADIAALMAGADLFVLPSLFEGLPLVVLEAMAAGLPVVGTAVCGTSEAVADGITGRLVPPRDPARLSAAILEVLEHPRLAAAWGAAGRIRVARDFTAARMAAETAAIYEEVHGPASAQPFAVGDLWTAYADLRSSP